MPSPHPRPWHRTSQFGAGTRRPLDREQRARFRYLLAVHRRARRISPTCRDIGEALLRRLGQDGQCDPAHETLADDAGCSDRTVRRATAALRALGLLSWRQRLVRDGWAVRQTSNAYALSVDAALPTCGGQIVREIRLCRFRDASPRPAPPAPPTDAQAARAELAEVARRMEARLQAKIGGKVARGGA
ncbi:MAG: helix-turn-helix domain-containing protein [Bradyrhizobium sp.]|uniref:helix-turn-helix domain-containing protein n=1 Tax=Bradyrhizobium sp. TaxID=376 RepID=UPI003D12084A